MKTFKFLFIPILLAACIGVDELEDPIVGARIETNITQVGLLIGDTATVSATYFDQYGIEQDLQISWLSEDEGIAAIDLFGLVSGVSPGQTTVKPFVGATEGPAILVTVVATADEVGQVIITGPVGNQVEVGATIQLNAAVQTVDGTPISGLDVAWFSSDEAVLEIDSDGMATGISNGISNVYAIVDGVQSNTISVLVGSVERTGPFSSANGYETSGTARLYFSQEGALMLELSQDFETEFALGTFVYLSNSTSGTTTAANGLEIAGISTNGFKLFNVTNVDPSVGIDTYNRVIILCKPASITFGHATMQ